MEDLNFSELGRRISMVFDKDHATNEEQSIIEQINSHPNGNEAMTRERIIRGKIKEKMQRPAINTGLIDQIKNKVGL